MLEPSRTNAETEEEFYVVSDIHGNRSALKAVLGDILRRNPNSPRIFNLGDIIGDGGDTQIATDVSMRFAGNAGGNHEEGLKLARVGYGAAGLTVSTGIGRTAAETIVKVNEQLKGEENGKRFEFLTSLPLVIQIAPDIKGSHAFERNVGSYKYSMPEKLAERYGIKPTLRKDPRRFFEDPKVFTPETTIALIGHDHVPFALVRDKDGKFTQIIPERVTDPDRKIYLVTGFTLEEGEQALVNGGAVGLARNQGDSYFPYDISRMRDEDGTPLPVLGANYLAIRGPKGTRTVEFRTMIYDYSKTEASTREAGMDPSIFSRLRNGRMKQNG
jgi:hypothetical protein